MRDRNVLSGWSWTWARFRSARGGVLFLCAGTAVQSILQVGFAVLTRTVIDSGLSGDPRFPRWGAALLAVLALTAALRGAVSWSAGHVSDQASARLRRELLDALEHSALDRLQTYHSGALLNRGMADVKTLCDGMTGTLPTLAGDVVRLAAALAALLLLSPRTAALLLCAGTAAGAAAAWMRPALKRRQKAVRGAEERAFAGMQEDLQQLELIQGLGAEEETLRRYDDLLRDSLSAKARRRRLSVGCGTALSAGVQLGTGALLLWGVREIYLGAFSYGTLTAMLQLLALFRGPVMGLSGLWGRLTAMEVSGARLRELLELRERREPAGPAPSRVDAVVFEQVTFRYRAGEPPVLDQFSARFDLTGWTCLTGLSGQGKSTVFKLILGLYRPQSGRVYLETDCGELPCGPDTRQFFAYVPQDHTMRSGTILENLRLASPEADINAVGQALDTAGADFVWTLPDRERTQLKEHNGGLSMGQLQRLAIARAVLMRRPVLLLDECTSALDAQNERSVLLGLRRLECGALIVSHRPEVLEPMAEIWKMEERR